MDTDQYAGTAASLNALSFKVISDEAAKLGLSIVMENVPGVFSSVDPLNSIFKAVPALSFHLDVGHAFFISHDHHRRPQP